MTVCPSCAEPLEPEDVFCGACGTNLADPPPAPTPDTGDSGTGDSASTTGDSASTTGDFVLAAPAHLLLDDEDESAAAGPPCTRCDGGHIADDGYCDSCGAAQPRPRDHMERALDGVAGVSDRGVRHHRNEDCFTVAATSLPDGASAVVAVVCDGVSSATRPDEASQSGSDTASESLLTALESGTEPLRAMHDALLDAARAVDALAYDGTGPAPGDGHHNSPACTCVAAVATGGTVTIGWIGDSRAYWVPDDRETAEPYRLTEDDSWAARMVSAGLMAEAEAYADPRAHAITGWLGADAGELDPHTLSFTPHVPGVVLVCTDGLWNYAEAATALADAVPADARTEPLRAAQELVKFALAGGGHDNITVAVLPFPPAPVRRPESVERTPTVVDLPVVPPTT
ncbi:PP2C family serine/threonine-protein phosphatase [Streptomyces sp. NPDC092296]|uniref:PP2C family serine/threonine-protein phosphatase n=1 Tax=Streptomyces sp. NPDC092296 TaxID=3366012 RepID=UPI00381ACEC6